MSNFHQSFRSQLFLWSHDIACITSARKWLFICVNISLSTMVMCKFHSSKKLTFNTSNIIFTKTNHGFANILVIQDFSEVRPWPLNTCSQTLCELNCLHIFITREIVMGKKRKWMFICFLLIQAYISFGNARELTKW